MIENPIRSLLKLRRKLPAVLTPIFILFFFLYIPLIHSNINASEKGSDTSVSSEGVGPIAPMSVSQRGPIATDLKTVFAPFVAFNPVKPPGAPPRPAAKAPAPPVPHVSELSAEKAGKIANRAGRARKKTRRRSSYLPPDITRGSVAKMEVALTFDGGYSAFEATEILDALRAREIKTTIFLTGIFIKRHPEVTRQIVLDGHEVGNHTMTHPHLTSFSIDFKHRRLAGVSRSFLIKELRDTEELFKLVTGSNMAPLWRAPYGEINTELRRWAFTQGYLHIGWTYDHETKESLDTLDWVDDTTSKFYLSSTEIKSRILDFGRGAGGVKGGIILMHLGTGRRLDRAVSILGELIDDLRDDGYRFVTVSSLLKGDSALSTAGKIKKRRGYKLLSKKRQEPGPS